MDSRFISVDNYLIPQNPQPRIYLVTLYNIGIAPGFPAQTIDFRPLNLNGDVFWPQAVYYSGMGLPNHVRLHIDQIPMLAGIVQAGRFGAFNYPGVKDQTITVTSLTNYAGPLVLAFCNFPVFPMP
jgi:hypothetical protein